jgi:hypothetical protein
MTRVILHSKVDPDGILRLNVPVGVVDADREMLVTIEPANSVNDSQGYAAWLDAMAGSWQGEFERLPAASFDSRDSL